MLRYLSDRLHHLLRKQKLAYRLEMLLSVSTGRVFLDTVSPAPQFTEAYKAFQEVVDNYVQVILKYRACKVIDNSEVAQPTKSMESGQQTFYFTGMFLLKLAGHVTKLSINSNWLLVFILLSVIIFIGWRVYSCLVH